MIEIFGKGVYTPREASRLLGVPHTQVVRWTHGSGATEALWDGYYQQLDPDSKDISFMDLIEVRVVNALRKAGLSLQGIRYAMERAEAEFKVERPLITKSFKTDGREIYMEAVDHEGDLVSLSKKRFGQKAFKEIVSQSFLDLEYEGEYPKSWWPESKRHIVIDPDRAFGEPILNDFMISTGQLFNEYERGSSTKDLADLYEVPHEQVVSAIKFEQRNYERAA